MAKRLFILWVPIVFLFGCRSINYSDSPWGVEPVDVQLQRQINIMKYDDSLATWGEPISVFDGDEVFVVTWGSEKVGPVVTVASPVGNSAMVTSGQQRSGWKVSATFNKKTRLLTSIQYIKW